MSKTKTSKRKKCSGAFKAKVALEAVKGLKTVGQIAREYEIHPVQVTQWKKVIRERLPQLFEAGAKDPEPDTELVSQLHEKIGQLTVELDWLKKSPNSWASEGSAPTDQIVS